MVRGLPSSEWSMRAWLKCSSWSTASLPTRASPTNSTRSGEFTLISCTERRGGREGREGGEGGRVIHSPLVLYVVGIPLPEPS